LFLEEFAFRLPASINFVGGGGKTALILRLAEEFSRSVRVIYTTTTRIHPPHPRNGLAIISSDDIGLLRLILQRAGRDRPDHVRTFVVTRPAMTPDLLKGVEPDFGRFLDRDLFRVLLNEADGARGMSLKMPREGEPVLMEDSEYLVPVLGLDCVNKPLGPATLFRWEMAAGRYSLKEGETLTPKLAAQILLHPEGVCKGWRKGMEVIPFINKVDSEQDDGLAREVVEALLRQGSLPVKRVVCGSAQERRAVSLAADGS
jgi:probable selenium-dependent hydroxylase accessory protein YqeC